jgi:hypothetical protein
LKESFFFFLLEPPFLPGEADFGPSDFSGRSTSSHVAHCFCMKDGASAFKANTAFL